MTYQENYYYLGVKALILNNERKLLLLKKKRSSGVIFWDIPGGRIERGETELVALQRELEEEIGLCSMPKPSKLNMHLTNVRLLDAGRNVGLILSLYQIQLNSNLTIQLSDEHVDYQWFYLIDAKKLLELHYPKSLVDDLNLLGLHAM